MFHMTAILSATTITAGGVVFGLYCNIGKNEGNSAPNTFMWQGNYANIQSNGILYSENLKGKKQLFNVIQKGVQLYFYNVISI